MARLKSKRTIHKEEQAKRVKVLLIVLAICILILFASRYRAYYFESNPAKLQKIGSDYLKKKEYHDALSAFEKAIQINDTPETNYHLGIGLLRSGKAKESFKYIEKAYISQPENYQMVLAMGEYYLDRKNKGKALEYYNKAVELEPENPVVYLERGKFYFAMKETDNAYTDVSKSKDLDPENIELYPVYAEICTKKGLFIAAFDSYDQYMRMKVKEGIPYSFLLTEESDIIKKKMRSLRDMAGEL